MSRVFSAFPVMDTSSAKVVYTQDSLLALRRTGYGVRHPIPTELWKQFRRCRAGAKLNAKRWRYNSFLPSVLMGIINSLLNECYIAALVRTRRLHRECSLMCFTETWLNDNVPDSYVNLSGFCIVQVDRDAKMTSKNKSG